uniref:Uncharacterized protein n=4 Tax=unclassified bacterial viruses TaxID=12333 RepID=A0AAU6W316_9VIRU
MPSIEQQIAAMTAPSPPAVEVLSIERETVESILAELEEKDPIRPIVTYLRTRLAEPKIELWAIHSVGPGEEYPCMNKEDAVRRAKELRDLGDEMKAERIARGESVEMWTDWVTNVIPSPWEPAEHFEIMAEEWMDDADSVRQHAIKLTADQDVLVSALKLTRESLRACQATIHLCGGFDPAYVNNAQAAMKVADEALSKISA